MPRRTYTQHEIDTALLTLYLSGRNSVEASKRLKDQGIDINPRTLRAWHRGTHADRYREIVQRHAPDLEKEIVEVARLAALKANEGVLEAVEATRQQLRDGELKDPSTAARNLAVAAGVTTDKSLLLEGRPTEIHGTDLEGLQALMRKALGKPAIDSTAVEDDTPRLPPAA